MKRRILALSLALLLGLTGCGTETVVPTVEPSPSPPPVVTPTEVSGTADFVLPCYPDQSFHPITGQNRTNLSLTALIYEGLFELDSAFIPKGVLCESYTVSEDGLTWTLNLRPGVTFSDGSALTAEDVASSLRLAMGEGSVYGARMTNIRAVRAAGETAVTVTLTRPNGNLPALLDIPVLKRVGETTLGTGPYAMATGSEGTLLLRPNTGWWQNKPLPVDEIKLYPIGNADALIQAFDTREISLVCADLTGTNALGFSGSYEAWDYPTSVMLYVGYQAKKGPCADGAVRTALSYGFDRAAVAKSLLSGHAIGAALPISPGSPLYDKRLADSLEYAPQRVDEALTAAGWVLENGVRQKGRETLNLTMIVNTDNNYKVAVADYLAKDFAKAGVAVTVKKLTWEEYNAALTAGDFDLYLGQVKLTGDFDLSPLLTRDGTLNYGGYADPDAEALLAAYLAAGETARPAAAADLCRRVSETAPFTVLCFKSWSVLTHWGKMSGVAPTQQNIFNHFTEWKLPK